MWPPSLRSLAFKILIIISCLSYYVILGKYFLDISNIYLIKCVSKFLLWLEKGIILSALILINLFSLLKLWLLVLGSTDSPRCCPVNSWQSSPWSRIVPRIGSYPGGARGQSQRAFGWKAGTESQRGRTCNYQKM